MSIRLERAGGLAGALVIFVALSSGCASMMYGSSQEVTFSSVPSGADLEINGKPRGTTPAHLKLWRGKSHSIVFRREGYEDRVVEVGSSWSGKAVGWSFVGALAWWGPFEWLVDLPMGSLRELDRTSVRERLEPTPETKQALALAEQRKRAEKVRLRRKQQLRAQREELCRTRGRYTAACQLRGYSSGTIIYPAQRR